MDDRCESRAPSPASGLAPLALLLHLVPLAILSSPLDLEEIAPFFFLHETIILGALSSFFILHSSIFNFEYRGECAQGSPETAGVHHDRTVRVRTHE